MVLQTYEDGSELTATDFAKAVGVGAILAAVVVTTHIKVTQFRERRWMKKNFPEDPTTKVIDIK